MLIILKQKNREVKKKKIMSGRIDYDVRAARIIFVPKNVNLPARSMVQEDGYKSWKACVCVCVLIETIDPSLRPVNTNRCMTGLGEKLQMTNKERRRKESNVCSHWMNLVPGTPESLATQQDISILRLWTVHTRRLPHAGTGADLHQLESQD